MRIDHAGSTGRQVERFQDKAVKELRTYVTQTWSDEAEDRFPKLLLRLPPLRSLQPGLMEELFFAALIGTVHIDSVIPYILRMDSTEYNGQFGGIAHHIFTFPINILIIYLILRRRSCN